jgi:transposase
MTNKKFREYQPHQIMAFPPSLDDVLPPEHPAYFVRDFVAGLDLSELYADYPERRGQPPYHPRMMVGVWLYGYMVGIRSSRKLEQAIKENLGFRVVAGNQQPDHWTLSHFRRRHHKTLGNLFNQTVWR